MRRVLPQCTPIYLRTPFAGGALSFLGETRHTRGPCGRAAQAPYFVLHRNRFALHLQVALQNGGLLPRLFTLAFYRGMFSVALSIPKRLPFRARFLRRIPALRCLDFPLGAKEPEADVRLRLLRIFVHIFFNASFLWINLILQ